MAASRGRKAFELSFQTLLVAGAAACFFHGLTSMGVLLCLVSLVSLYGMKENFVEWRLLDDEIQLVGLWNGRMIKLKQIREDAHAGSGGWIQIF